MTNKFTLKISHLLAVSAISTILSNTVHAGELVQISSLDQRLISRQINSTIPGKSIQSLSGHEALARGKQILEHAKTAKQYKTALAYFKYAATKDLSEAMFQCAILYLDNQYTPANDELAMDLLEQASAKGHKQAATALNYIRYGDAGIGC